MPDTVAQQWQECWRELPDYLSQHVMISVLALALGIAISLPLAIAATKRKALRWPVLTAVSVIQTVPSIALLALMYPLLVGLSLLLERAAGAGFSALGFYPTLIALTLYSMLPIVRNTVTGITQVDPAMTEAARGLGMTPRQVLTKVELPLAAPTIVAGVRTATVWVIGIATLSTPIGQTSLGDYIFPGLQREAWLKVAFGCVCAAALAMTFDLLIGLMEDAAKRRSRARAAVAAGGLLAVLIAALSPLAKDQPHHHVGAKTFQEQFILAAVLQQQLTEHGFHAGTVEGLGSAVMFKACAAGEIDCCVDYSGTIWANYMGRTDTADAETVLREVTAWVEREHGMVCLGSLGFENAYALAMPRDKAAQLGIASIADLAGHAPSMTIGGDFEFFDRPEWKQIASAYGLAFADRKRLQSTFMYKAVADGEVDVISAFSSDGRIAAYGLVVLDDPRNAIPPYDAVLLVSAKAAKTPGFIEAVRPLVGRISVDTMRRANQRVDLDGTPPAEAARRLREEIGLR